MKAKAKPLVIAIASFFAAASSSHSAILIGYTSGNGQPTPVSNSDLLQTSVSSSSFGAGSFTQENSGGTSFLTDGSFGGTTQGEVIPTVASVGPNGGTSATYNLDLAASPLGYNLSAITLLTGWNDGGRDELNIEILYSTVSDPLSFISLATAASNPDTGFPSAWIRGDVTDSTGTLAGNVASVRFNFNLPVENGYVGIRELDVVGSAVAATIPEPSSFALLGLGVIGLAARRRRA